MVGKRIKALRTEQSITFDAFVEETELGRGYISELERGLVVPTLRTLGIVAEVLDVTVADLVLEDSPREELFELTRRLKAKDVSQLLRQAKSLAPHSQ